MSSRLKSTLRHGRRGIAAVVALIGLMGVAQAGNTLEVVNQCSKTIWIQQQNINDAPELVWLKPGASHIYNIQTKGDPSTRVWPKTGCDSSGNNCRVGQSVPPCPAAGCAPPVNSILEVNFGCVSGSKKCPVDKAMTAYNVSQVDGFTLPFKVLATGTEPHGGCDPVVCRALDMAARCPTSEDLSSAGKYPKLRREDLRMFSPGTKKVVGCFSPCEKLTAPTAYGGLGYAATDDEALLYCCPSYDGDPAKTEAVKEACLAGPGSKTKYVNYVHNVCRDSAYAWAYDDVNGSKACKGVTNLKMVVCP